MYTTDAVLALLKAYNKPITKTKLVKLLYLASRKAHMKGKRLIEDATWRMYHYGPYAFEIDDALKELYESGLIDMREVPITDEVTAYEIRLNDEDVDVEIPDEIKEVVEEWGNRSLREILDYVYSLDEVKKAKELRDQLGIYVTLI